MTMVLHPFLGDNIVEMGANWIHGPCKENPVFCLSENYGLLEPEALLPENQTKDFKGYVPEVSTFFTSSGNTNMLALSKYI